MHEVRVVDIPVLFKLIGSATLLFASGAAGQMWSARYRARVWQLRELQSAIRRLEAELRYAAVPLPRALRAVSDHLNRPVCLLFEEMERRLRRAGAEGLSAENAWLASIEVIGPSLALNGEDLKLLRRLGDLLGACDAESQLQQFALCREQLGRAEEEAQQARRQNERLWPAVGLCVGLMVVIWLV